MSEKDWRYSLLYIPNTVSYYYPKNLQNHKNFQCVETTLKNHYDIFKLFFYQENSLFHIWSKAYYPHSQPGLWNQNWPRSRQGFQFFLLSIYSWCFKNFCNDINYQSYISFRITNENPNVLSRKIIFWSNARKASLGALILMICSGMVRKNVFAHTHSRIKLKRITF